MFKFWGFQRKIKIYADENFSNGSNCLNNFMTFFIIGKCAAKVILTPQMMSFMMFFFMLMMTAVSLIIRSLNFSWLNPGAIFTAGYNLDGGLMSWSGFTMYAFSFQPMSPVSHCQVKTIYEPDFLKF